VPVIPTSRTHTPSIPLTTSPARPGTTSIGYETEGPGEVVTITYTLGTGTTTSVVTTTIHKTRTRTETVYEV
jgi:hypothetical protein